MIHFFFHLSKMEISDNEITIGNEILNTNTMMVTTIDDPSKELIPSITLDWNNEKYNNLTITIKNENGDVLKEQTDTGQFTYRDKKITLCIQIQVDLDGDTSLYYSLSFLELSQSLESYQHEGLTFDVICYMPVILQLYYSFSPYENGILEAKIRTGLLEELKDILFIPEPLLEEILRYKYITFILFSVRHVLENLIGLEKVYEVKSTKKNPCNFYDNFLALAKFCLSEKNKGQTTNHPLPDRPNFYILFKKKPSKTILSFNNFFI